jgi:alkylation response protein AidB-like acyl-CoA dehydrogenase
MAIEVEISRLFSYRVAWMYTKGLSPNYEVSISKIYGSEMLQHLAQVGMQILGLKGQLMPGSKWAPLAGRVGRLYLAHVARTIGGGTTEIQKNIIAQRGLGLPRD